MLNNILGLVLGISLLMVSIAFIIFLSILGYEMILHGFSGLSC
jgi:hypothetical protein